MLRGLAGFSRLCCPFACRVCGLPSPVSVGWLVRSSCCRCALLFAFPQSRPAVGERAHSVSFQPSSPSHRVAATPRFPFSRARCCMGLFRSCPLRFTRFEPFAASVAGLWFVFRFDGGGLLRYVFVYCTFVLFVCATGWWSPPSCVRIMLRSLLLSIICPLRLCIS